MRYLTIGGATRSPRRVSALALGAHAKTGTAEYGTGPESQLNIDGWLMGYDGDIAFAIVTHDTGGPDGGPVDGPLIANFLGAVRSTG